MADTPVENTAMLNKITRTYEAHLFMGDRGMWTVVETTTRPILLAPSKAAAYAIIGRMRKADESGEQL